MAIARAHLVNPALARWYHCISRCVRRAFLLGEGQDNRKGWIEQRLEYLAQIFAVAVGGFAVMDNHIHLLLRIDPHRANEWSDEEVVRRWGRLFPPRDKSRRPIAVSDDWVQSRLKDTSWVAKTRERLLSLSWFMKCLKEPLARLANRQEQVRRQAELILTQMKTALEAAGSDLNHVLKCNVLCISKDRFKTFNEIYKRFFPTNQPARIFFCVPEWTGPFDIEIDCIALTKS
jgi:hypothetical protein